MRAVDREGHVVRTLRHAKRIAINAQLDPLNAGGVETNLLSMLRALERMERQFAVSILALDRHVSAFRDEAPFADVKSWPYGQQVQSSLRQAAVRGQRLRQALGRCSHVFDQLVYGYRLLRYAAPVSAPAAQIDALLASWGVHAVHFPTSQLFDTSLPYLYEPWDLQHLHYPQFFPKHEHDFRERTYSAGCRGATLVVTATRWVKDDIARRYVVPPEKIVAIPRSSSIARRALGTNEIEAELRRARVPDEFIFYPAMCFEHKNHIRLLEALAQLRDRNGLRINLVLSGRRHEPFWPKVAGSLRNLQLLPQVTELGAVSEELLTALYRRARFMVFPSLFEGLGLPVLEAFYHGLPVLAARATCLPEVVGDAGLLFEPTNVEAIAAAIKQGYQQPALLRVLAEKGYRRLDEFSWERGRTLFSACYKHVLRLPETEEERALFARARSQ